MLVYLKERNKGREFHSKEWPKNTHMHTASADAFI